MSAPREPADPMHGVTLEMILNELVAHYGWNAMGQKIEIRCFTSDPSVASSLKFPPEDAVGACQGRGDVPGPAARAGPSGSVDAWRYVTRR